MVILGFLLIIVVMFMLAANQAQKNNSQKNYSSENESSRIVYMQNGIQVPQENNGGAFADAGVCINGDEQNCTLQNGCGGTSICQHGEWSRCFQRMEECRTGQIAPCPINSCVFGVVRCDACGKWGKCAVSN